VVRSSAKSNRLPDGISRATLDALECQIAVLTQTSSPSECLAKFIDTVPHIVWSATADGRLAYFNSSWTRLLGTTAGVSVETALLGKLHVSDRQRWCERWRRALESGEPYEMEYRLQSESDGRARWYLERGTPVHASKDGPLDCWLVTATLIDDHKLREDELHSMLLRRDEFFATLLHELRNPLAPIENALELLGAEMSDPARMKVARGIIQRQLRQLTRLVDDLLDVSRIARGDIELQRHTIDLAEVVSVAVEAARPIMQLRQHKLTTGAPNHPVLLEADSVRLAQVLTNVLINAAKYTHPGGHISVTTGQEEGNAAIRVRDNGIGIAPEKMPEVFKLFAQAAPRSPASGGGLGVGLAIARQLVELHGGSISARSEGLGRGSEFTIRLPIASLESPGLETT
jgi:PAS domain S-box-containing protein